jgi:tRNA-dihydrouridine synthase
VDGIMIGRASIGNPWIFRDIHNYFETGEILDPPSLEEKVQACRDHFTASLDWKGNKLGVLEMRRHYTNYFKGLPGIKPFRLKLVTTDEPEEIHGILDEIKEKFAGIPAMLS